MTRRFAASSTVVQRAAVLAGALLCLPLAACAPPGLPKTTTPAENLPYPSFGTPAQIGTRPVMTTEEQQKKQGELEKLGINRASDMQSQINQGGDLQTGQ